MKNNKLKLFKLFSLAVFKICVLSCEEQLLLEFDEKTFYQQWAAWEAQGITDYSVKVKFEQFSPSTRYCFYRITVKDGVMIEKKLLDGYDDYQDTDNPTISAIYTGIDYYYYVNKNLRGSIKITYNKDFHFPETTYFDLTPKEHPWVFGSGAYYLSEFTPLTPAIEE